jgi:hypothetical protein
MHRDPFPFHHKSFLIDQMPRYTSLGGPNAPLEQAVFHKRVWADDHGSLGKGLTTTCNIQENVKKQIGVECNDDELSEDLRARDA